MQSHAPAHSELNSALSLAQQICNCLAWQARHESLIHLKKYNDMYFQVPVTERFF